MRSKQGIFGGKKEPNYQSAWTLYEQGLAFKRSIGLNDTVRVNENFYIGKQWEGVEANGLPTPQFNFLKRVVGFIVATITTDNVKVTASVLASTEKTGELTEPVRIVNEEFEALMERNRIPAMLREFARNAAVDGDSCLYSYWDGDEETGQDSKGAVKTELIENTRVFFGNPNDRRVQSQPWIMISSREICREARKRADENGFADWGGIGPDEDERGIDNAKNTDDKTTVLLTMWRDEETGHIWAFESTRNSGVRKPWDTGLTLYPICWLNWDYVQDCYHGQAMLTGLIPNQIFVNKIWAASMLSFLKTAYPKVIFDRTRVKQWDNRVGAAIGISGGDVNTVAKVMEPATISPQISQFIQLAVEQTEQSLGATSVALGDTRPDNTSAIIALQRAASTPTELTKQNLYQCVEDLFRIYLEFMGEYYGKRRVDMEPTEKEREAAERAGKELPDETQKDFDFSLLKKHPMILKLDVGASSYYSEIASMQTLDNLLKSGHISALQYLERIPDGYIPGRRALIAELKAAAGQGAPGGKEKAEIPGGMKGKAPKPSPEAMAAALGGAPGGAGLPDLKGAPAAPGMPGLNGAPPIPPLTPMSGVAGMQAAPPLMPGQAPTMLAAPMGPAPLQMMGKGAMPG